MSEWYYAINRRQMGPVSEPELRELASAGALRAGDLVWKEGMPEWVQASTCADLFPDGLPRVGRSRLGDEFDSSRNYVDDGLDDPWRRPPQRASSSGWVVGLCVVAALLVAMVVGVVAYFVVANGPGNGGHRGGKVWQDRLTLTDQVDPTKDPTRQGCSCKIYTYHMVAGTTYQIDLESDDFDSYLRIEDPAGREVANDDDSGGTREHPQDARIIYTAMQTGLHTIYASTFDPNFIQQGAYTLRVFP